MLIHAGIIVKSFQDFFYYHKKYPGITLPLVYSEKHESEHFELIAVDKVCNLFGAEFCDMKNKLRLGGVLGRERIISIIKKEFFQQQGFLRLKFFFSNSLA